MQETPPKLEPTESLVSRAALRARAVRRTAALSVAGAVAMGALAFASVPLYRLFCQVTGYGGTPRIESSAPQVRTTLADGLAQEKEEVEFTVRFSADVASDLPWEFEAEERVVKVRAGEQNRAWFRAKNLSSERAIVGQATFNVTPLKVGPYFHKVNCFCFNEQPLQPGEEARLDVQFFVDPNMLADAETKEVRTITLAYTFHFLEEGVLGVAAPHDHSTHDHSAGGEEAASAAATVDDSAHGASGAGTLPETDDTPL